MNRALATTDDKPKMMLLAYMADKYALTEQEFSRTVRATCGMPNATPEQFAAFLIVAKTYDLNPVLREIYAFPAKGGGVVPIVSIDGWVNLINSHGQCDGFEFEMENDDNGLVSCTCRMYRKDRKHPVVVTEYLSECKRPTDPWKMAHRMLRHKALIQAARYAFGFSGVYDEDEARTIAESAPVDVTPKPRVPSPSEVIDHQPAQEQPEHDAKTGEIIDNDTFDAAEDAVHAPEPTAIKPYALDPGSMGIKKWTNAYIALINQATSAEQLDAWHEFNKSLINQLKEKSPPSYKQIAETDKARRATFGDTKTTGPDPRKDYEHFLSWAADRMNKVETAEELETFWQNEVEAWSAELMPPDQDDLMSYFRKAETRLAP